ncbi:hypothetical protein JCM8115_001594 [Rhodotorula mucilaginosa]
MGAYSALADFPETKTSDGDVTSLRRDLEGHPPPAVSSTSTFFIRALPILASLCWLGTLTTLLVMWAVEGHRVYSGTSGAVPYVSDVAYYHRHLSVAGSSAAAIFFVASLSVERALRSTRVLPEVTSHRKLWQVVGIADVFTGACAGLALCLLSVYDSFHTPKAHLGFAICFIVFHVLSGLLQTIEVSRLWHEHPDRHGLRDGCLLKWLILAISSGSGLAFIGLHYKCSGNAYLEPVDTCYRVTTAAAICQWIACYCWGAYMSTLIIDLWPVHRHTLRALPRMQADSKGNIHGVWLPSATDPNALYEYRPIPAHLELQRFPPAQGPDDAAPCGVRLAPRRGFDAEFEDDETYSRHTTRRQQDWYETGKRASRRVR